jgi:hypothetical protein
MDTVVAPRRDELGKFLGVVGAFPGAFSGLVLDVGARSGIFRQAVENQPCDYFALDLQPPADIIANAEQGLTFRNASFDTVIALDVLEHTNEFHRAFAEICRIASKWVVLSLPNIYVLETRWRFLRGRPIGGKYGLPVEPVNDRHRWVLSFREAQLFCSVRALVEGFELSHEVALVGPRRGFGPAKWLIAKLPNVLAPTYVALLQRNAQTPATESRS